MTDDEESGHALIDILCGVSLEGRIELRTSNSHRSSRPKSMACVRQ